LLNGKGNYDETYGILCYQEDVSKTAVALAGFDEEGGERHMERNKRLYPISEGLFNRKVLSIHRRLLHLERPSAQSTALHSVLRNTVHTEGRLPVAVFAWRIRVLAFDKGIVLNEVIIDGATMDV
jgi:hypothetical protein